MSSGDTLAVFTPLADEPPASAYATLGSRNGHPMLQFNDTTSWAAIFTAIMPRNYGGGGITVYAHWAAVAITGNVGWLVALERLADAAQDIDSDGFASNQTITAATVPGTSGQLKTTSVAITDGANMDSVVGGDLFRIKIARNTATDTAVGDAQLLGLEIKET